MEKFTDKLLVVISSVLLIGIVAIYCIGAVQYVKKHREWDNEIENCKKKYKNFNSVV